MKICNILFFITRTGYESNVEHVSEINLVETFFFVRIIAILVDKIGTHEGAYSGYFVVHAIFRQWIVMNTSHWRFYHGCEIENVCIDVLCDDLL